MRGSILDTTKTISVVFAADIFGDNYYGFKGVGVFYVVENCDVNGEYTWPTDYDTAEEAQTAIQNYLVPLN
jgi:hypothetical protein